MGRTENKRAIELMSIYPRIKLILPDYRDRDIARDWGITYESLRWAKRQFGYEKFGWKRDIDKLIE